jgi:hypothetical protein
MLDQNSQNANAANAPHSNRLGAVAREKYEAILQTRLLRCIAAQEAKVNARKKQALQIYLEQNRLANKLSAYRLLLQSLLEFFGEPDWHYPVWLRDDDFLFQNPKVVKGMDRVLRQMPELKPVFAELDRLKAIQEQITEKVWLAGAPEEIAELLKEIGEPPANSADRQA